MPSAIGKMLRSIKKKVCCKFQGLNHNQEKSITEALLRILFLYFDHNPIYITILSVLLVLHMIYQILMFPVSFWNNGTVLFGTSMISLSTCFSMITVSKNEMARFFDSPLDIRNNKTSLERTSVVTLQALFGLSLVLLLIQLHLNKSYLPYDVVLAILCILVTTRLIVCLVIWTNCVYRTGEKMGELRLFLNKCNGKTEYEHLALKMKDIILCLDLLNKNVAVILFWALILITFCFFMVLKNIISIAIFAFVTAPFVLLFLVCSYANVKLYKLKVASLRLFDLQFVTPVISSLVNFFWMSRTIEELPALEVKYLFHTTFSNALRIVFYSFILFISFERCITTVLKCKNC